MDVLVKLAADPDYRDDDSGRAALVSRLLEIDTARSIEHAVAIARALALTPVTDTPIRRIVEVLRRRRLAAGTRTKSRVSTP